MNKTHKIIKVVEGSIGHELGIKSGDRLYSVNGEEVLDIFDYQFAVADENIAIEILNSDNEIDEYEIEKDYTDDLGLVFESSLMDEYKSCRNKCIFCFIDQMPPGMRDTLYFKDDDSRLSFLQGNYITLTNMSEDDIRRIIRYRMEPVNISIHTMDADLRCRMLNNRFAGEVLKYLDLLKDADIHMNAQIVLCKGINDGENLQKTISRLYEYAPVMESVSVVPVGLTKYRDGLYPLKCFEREDALGVIKTIEDFQKKSFKEKGFHFIHASDEFYLLAGLDVPEEKRYDGYLQLENGVGMLRLLKNEVLESLKYFDKKLTNGRNISIATGSLAFPFIKSLAAEIIEKAAENGLVKNNLNVSVYEIKNEFFGEKVTVSGLITGKDLTGQLKGKELGTELLLPVSMFRAGEEYFLDDVTKEEAERELNVKIRIVPREGAAFAAALFGIDYTENYRRQIYEQTDCGDCWQA